MFIFCLLNLFVDSFIVIYSGKFIILFRFYYKLEGVYIFKKV